MTVKKQVKVRVAKHWPKYQIHKASNRACVWWRGKRHYLGVANSPKSLEAYNRFIAEIARTNGLYDPQPQSASAQSDQPAQTTVAFLILAYLKKIEPEISEGEYKNMLYSFRPLRKLYGHTPVEQIGPKALKQVRQAMIDEGLTRKVINQRIGRIKRLFKYAVAEEMVPPSILHALQAVEGLRAGRTEAPEAEPIKPVDDEQVELLVPFLSHVTAAMVKFCRLTTTRPGECCRIRACDIDRTGEVWFYMPYKHKTRWRGKERIIPIGPQAQAVLKPFMDRPEEDYLFTPQESYAWLRQHPMPGGKQRKTPLYPSELRRREKYHRKSKKPRRFRPCFTTDSFDRSIEKAIERAHKAGVMVKDWTPNQLRHARATELRAQFGLEAAQVILGHAKADVTQIYAERDIKKATEVALATG